MSGFCVIIDNGHGRETPGKRSPDGRLLEWRWTRDVAIQLKSELEKRGITATLLVPEDTDVPLVTRVARANAIDKLCSDSILVSIHVNASPGKGWSEASGFSAWICDNASKRSERLASLLQSLAKEMGLGGNRWVPPEGFFRSNFYIVKRTSMPAVLTENLFQTNQKEVDYLLSDEGKKRLVALHVKAIERYIWG